MADVYAQLFQFLGHPWTAVAAQAETGLFLDVCQNHHVGPLPLAGRAAAIGAQTTFADIQNLAKAVGREVAAMLFDEPEPHGFWLAKKAVAFLRNSPFRWHGCQCITECLGAALEA